MRKKLKNLKKYSISNSKLAILRLEENFGNNAYLKGIKSTASKVNLDVVIDTTLKKFILTLKKLNADSSVAGILIFRPIPTSVDEDKLDRLIARKRCRLYGTQLIKLNYIQVIHRVLFHLHLRLQLNSLTTME